MDLTCIIYLSLLAGLGLFLLYHEKLLPTRAAWLASGCLLLLALGLRLLFFDYETLDYQNFLAKWAAFFRHYGGFLAFHPPEGSSTPFMNYNIPYLYFLALFSYLPVRDLYLIKLLSVTFDVLLAWAAARLCAHFTRRTPRLLGCFFTVLFLPTVFLNGAVWGQCDSLYVMPLLLGIELALRDRPKSSLVMAALAFGMKLQAVFVLPIWAVLWMKKKYKLRDFLIFPLSYVLLVLPAVLLGRPFLETITLYFSQTGSIGSGLNYNSPSVFAIFWNVADAKTASAVAIVAAFVFLFNMLGVAWINRARLSNQAILGMALLLAIGIPFLLPHMHERYFFGADVLSVVLGFACVLGIPAALLTQFASLLGYHAYLKMRYLLYMDHGSRSLIGVILLGIVQLLYDTAGKTENFPEPEKSALTNDENLI